VDQFCNVLKQTDVMRLSTYKSIIYCLGYF